MQITRLVVENFRSIAKAELNHLGPFVVFYGPNGGGKTNLLRALKAAVLTTAGALGAEVGTPIGAEDFRLGSDQMKLVVEMTFSGGVRTIDGVPVITAVEGTALCAKGAGAQATVRVRFAEEWLDVGRVLSGDQPLPSEWPGMAAGSKNEQRKAFHGLFVAALRRVVAPTIANGFTRLDDVRSFQHRRDGASVNAADVLSPIELLEAGRVEEAIARAGTSDDDTLRDRFNRLREVLAAPPLNLPEIEAVVPNRQYRLRLRAGKNGKRATLASEASSLGEQQILILLGSILFRGADVVAIEEPEAHLHAPTSGRALREVLRMLVLGGDIQQLFVATHSNLFDLDDSGFWSVSRDDAGTHAAREADLSKIDELHLFEPGAAKRVLQDLLRIGDGGAVVAHLGDRTLTAAEMLKELQEDTELGIRYAQTLSRATARWFARQNTDLSAE